MTDRNANDITPHIKLIEALAATMSNNMWASDIYMRCRQIEEALTHIRTEIRTREGGER